MCTEEFFWCGSRAVCSDVINFRLEQVILTSQMMASIVCFCFAS